MEFDRNSQPASHALHDGFLFTAPISDQKGPILSRTNSIDSCISISKLSSDQYSRQSNNSRHSTKSALSALLAAAEPEIQYERNYELDSNDGHCGCASREAHSDDMNVADSFGTTDIHASSIPSGEENIKRSGSDSRSHSFRSKSNSRSNSLSQSSMHSVSDGSFQQRERTSRLDRNLHGADASCSFTAQMRSVSHSPTEPSPSERHHSVAAAESARRILASNSFDSDLSDGGMGSDYAPHHTNPHSGAYYSGSDAEDQEEDVRAFDEFDNFNEFDRAIGRSHSSGTGDGHDFTASADSADDNSAAVEDAKTPPVNVHELTSKQLMLLILSSELVFDAKQRDSPRASHSGLTLAASFIRSSRDSIIGSLTHLGIGNQRAGSDNSLAAQSILQQNIANAALSSPKQHRRPPKVPSPQQTSGSGKKSAEGAQQATAEAEALVKQRLCIFPAEDDGSPMDDLPEYSARTNILRAGMDDFALVDKFTKKCLFQLKFEGRPDDDNSMMLDDSQLLASRSEEDCLSPTERAIHVGATSTTTTAGTKNLSSDGGAGELGNVRLRGMVGTTVDVLHYDSSDAALNPAFALGSRDPAAAGMMGRAREDSEQSSHSASSEDLRDLFARERSDSNNDIIQMFRTETDEMLQSKIEEAFEQARKSSINSSILELLQRDSANANVRESIYDPQPAREEPKRASESTKRKSEPCVPVKPAEDKNTKYIILSGRRNEDAEYKVLLRIPILGGKPYVTLPSEKSSKKVEDSSVKRSLTRDIEIASPNSKSESRPRSVLSPQAQRLGKPPSIFADKDIQVSAALRALQHQQQQEYNSDTELDARERSSKKLTDSAVNRRSLTLADQLQTGSGHTRHRTFDFAHLSSQLESVLTPKNVPGCDAERRPSGKDGINIRNPSTDSVGSELSSPFVLNPHTSSNHISFFAIPTGNTPTTTARKMPSKTSSHNSSGSNLLAGISGPGGMSATMDADLHIHGADHPDTGLIQIQRHSRSNSILSQADLTAGGVSTHRSSLSSEVSEVTTTHSALHQQLQAACLQGGGNSRSSSRSGSVNFYNSANLGGGGFSSDDCSECSSSSDSETDMQFYPPNGSPRQDSHSRTSRKGAKGLAPINCALGFEDDSGTRRSGNSSGTRTPKKTSPLNAAPREPGLAFAQVGDGAVKKPPAIDISTTSGAEMDASDEANDGDAGSTTEAAQPEKSSFYFLSRLFGTFRRSTALNATPRGSAVKIAIIHEAEFEDCDSNGSGSGNSTPTKEVG